MGRKQIKKTGAGAKKRWKVSEKVILIVAILLLLLGGIAIAGRTLMSTRLLGDATLPGGQLSTEIQTPSELQGRLLNLLVVGVSDDPNERESTRLTDTIMVVSVNIEDQKVNILQIPRDTYVGNETSTHKINAIYSQNPDNWDYAGLDGLSRMIYDQFQVTIDHYVTIQMDGFRDMINAIGGVTMDVPVDMELNGTYVEAGTQTLDGDQAIAVVRTRNVYANADIGRLQTQKIFMSALLEKVMSLSVDQMLSLIPTLLNYVTTDLTVEDCVSLYYLVRGMNSDDITAVTCPGEGVTVSGQSCWGLYHERTAIILNELFRPFEETPDIASDDLGIYDVVAEPYISEEEDFGLGTMTDYASE